MSRNPDGKRQQHMAAAVSRLRVHRASVLTCSLLAVLWGSHPVRAQLPVSDSDFFRVEPAFKQVLVDSTWEPFHMAIMIDNSTILGALAIPLTYDGGADLRVDSSRITAPDIRGVTYGPAGRNAAWTIKTSLINATSNNILLGFISFSSFASSSDTLCYVHFLAAPAPAGNVILDSTTAQFQHLGITSVLAEEYTPQWTPGVIRVSGMELAGDLNCDFEVTIGDIIYLVNYAIKSGPEPCNLALADANCNGVITMSDAIWLVNYLFRGGPPPEPPCSGA